MIDLTADEHPFYFNPYSAELSLKFPKAERNCKGGILASVYFFSLRDVCSEIFTVMVRQLRI